MEVTMSSKFIQALTAERIERLKAAFATSHDVYWDADEGELIHSGEYGLFRERAITDLLRLYTPQEFGIGSGFVITSQGGISTQCDVVIYDRAKTPGIVTDSHQSFYPVETVLAVGEVKSDVNSRPELIVDLEKLARTKAMREQIRSPRIYRRCAQDDYNPRLIPTDHMFTFLICNRLKFKPAANSLAYTEETAPRHYHNLVLSIHDGLYCYTALSDASVAVEYPIMGARTCPPRWVPANTDRVPEHFCCFLSWLYSAMTLATLLEPDMSYYLTDKTVDRPTSMPTP
jgi:hypothetical protein